MNKESFLFPFTRQRDVVGDVPERTTACDAVLCYTFLSLLKQQNLLVLTVCQHYQQQPPLNVERDFHLVQFQTRLQGETGAAVLSVNFTFTEQTWALSQL